MNNDNPKHIASRVLAVIPARAGSKGITKKNIAPLDGLPLIAWSILAAKAAKSVDRVIVSTDSEEFASIAQSFGAEVPFLRPIGLAGDTALISDAIQFTEDRLLERGESFDVIVTLFPSHPFRTPELIDQVVHLAQTVSFHVSTVRPSALGHWPFVLCDGPYGHFAQPNLSGTMFRDLSLGIAKAARPPEFAELKGLNNTAYILQKLKDGDARFGAHPAHLVIDDPAMYADIDTPEDLEAAHRLIEEGKIPWHPKNGYCARGPCPHESVAVLEGNLSVFNFRGSWVRIGSIEYDAKKWKSPAELRRSLEEEYPATKGTSYYLGIHPPIEVSRFEEKPFVHIDRATDFPVGIRKAYTELGSCYGLIDEGLRRTFGESVGSLVCKHSTTSTTITFPSAPAVNDLCMIDLWCDGDDQHKWRSSGLYRFDGTQWNYERAFATQRSTLDLKLFGTPLEISFAWNNSRPLVAVVSWLREGISAMEIRYRFEPVEIPDVLKANPRNSMWKNLISGDLITGRQQWPDLCRWNGALYIPKNCNDDYWFVRNE